MKYDFIKNSNDNIFYPVSTEEIDEVEKKLSIQVPKELREFYLAIGYGFIKGSNFNINLIMDPCSIRDFRLRQNDFEFYPDIEIYDEFEGDKLIFFEASEAALISIELSGNVESKIYYYDVEIANSLKEFLKKIQKDDSYYVELLN